MSEKWQLLSHVVFEQRSDEAAVPRVVGRVMLAEISVHRKKCPPCPNTASPPRQHPALPPVKQASLSGHETFPMVQQMIEGQRREERME